MKKCLMFRFVRKSNFFKKSAVILLIFSFFTSPFAYAQEVNTSPSEPVQQPEALNTQDATDKPLSELVNENEVTTSESNNEEIGNESANEDTEKDNSKLDKKKK